MKALLGIVLSVITLSVIAANTYAGGGDVVGNGGDVYICFRDPLMRDPASIELLDFYEGREMRGFKIDLGDKSLDPIAKVRLALSRLHRLDPERAERFLTRAEGFFTDLLFVKGNLTQIPDYGYVVIQDNCAIRQMARQKQRQFPEDKTFWIVKALWDSPLLDNDSRAGLILHEVIYEELIQHGAVDSIDARYLTALIASKELESRSVADYVMGTLNNLRVDSDYLDFRIGGLAYQSHSFDFYSNGSLAHARMARDGNLISGIQSINLRSGDELTFYPSGAVQRWWTGTPSVLLLDESLVPVNGSSYLYEDGRVREVQTDGQYWIHGGKAMFTARVSFWPNGMVRAGVMNETRDLSFADGTEKVVTWGDMVRFNEDGKALKSAPYDNGGWICFDQEAKPGVEVRGVRVIEIPSQTDAVTGAVTRPGKRVLSRFSEKDGIRKTLEEFPVIGHEVGGDEWFTAQGASLGVNHWTAGNPDAFKFFQTGVFKSSEEIPMFCRHEFVDEKVELE